MTKHSKLPWQWIGTMGSPHKPHYLVDGEHNNILFLDSGDITEQDAQYIVQACNLYPQLVEALKTISEMESYAGDVMQVVARAVLAQTEGSK
jgi:hypothetical protein